MDVLTVKHFEIIIETMTDIIIENEVPFCQLDSAAGDGDFGMSLAKGFREVKSKFGELSRESIGHFLKDVGMIITEFCGGASGPIWGSAFRSAAKYASGALSLDLNGIAEMLNCAVEGIQKRGGAKLGDKTLLDALIPAAQSLRISANSGLSISEASKLAAVSAVQGGEKTRSYVASKGRASYLGERSLDYPDAGAVAIGVIFTGISKKIEDILK